MRIAQLLLTGASAYERKCQRVDYAALRNRHEVTLVDGVALATLVADVLHVYGPDPLPTAPFRRLQLPYVASGDVPPSRLPFRRAVPPRFVLSPLAREADARRQLVPEAVEEAFFDRVPAADTPPRPDSRKVVGVYGPSRPGVRPAIEQAQARIDRTREDVAWRLFDAPPSPADLAGVDVWIDPASSDADLDGFCAEAIAAGKAVVASRTPINMLRLEKGRTGWLIPPADGNELTHAILGTLFKSEVAQMKTDAARQTAGKFRPRQRLRLLEPIYEILTA